MKNGKYQIVINGERRWRINLELVKKRKITSAQVAKIREIYVRKLEIWDCMKEMNPEDTKDLGFIKEADKYLDECEFELQEVWGFGKDPKFHKFWYRPHCSCPKMDNEDAYPTGQLYLDSECPVHKYKTLAAKKVYESLKWEFECTKIKKDNDKFAKRGMIGILVICILSLVIIGVSL